MTAKHAGAKHARQDTQQANTEVRRKFYEGISMYKYVVCVSIFTRL
jgi:hypothetical protein